MKHPKEVAKAIHEQVFGLRCDKNPGVKYFDETHFSNLVKEHFEFKNDNGFILRGGYYHINDYIKDTLIIFCHGMCGGHQAYMNEINYLAQAGYKVLSFDYQGTILSEGDKLGGFCQAIQDMDKCVSLINKDYKNIYIIGHSWGGFVAQATCYLHPEISKLVTLASMISIPNAINQYYRRSLFFLRKELIKIERKDYPKYADINMIDTLNYRKNLKALLIQSHDDCVFKYKTHQEHVELKNKNPNVEFIIEENKLHNPQYEVSAVKKLTKYFQKLDKIQDENEKIALANATDWDELGKLDKNVMDKIVNFIKNK